MSTYEETRNPESSRSGPLRVWGKDIPARNPHFTGRAGELELLRARLLEPADMAANRPPQPVVGLGGVGKTELVTEYVHRFGGNYDLIWWIRAETEATIRVALVRLCQRLHLTASPDYDESITVVQRALVEGTPCVRWLLIFDNAADPAHLSPYLPATTPYGHVIITSQVQNWERFTRGEPLEVGAFAEEESVAFLRQRAKVLAPVTANGMDKDEAAKLDGDRAAAAIRLAGRLGNLPLAEEHAVAYLNETNASVEEYLEQFRENAHRLFSSETALGYPRSVAAAWSVSMGALSPDALALFQLCAFFSSEAIAEELLITVGKGVDLPAELQHVLSDRHTFREALRKVSRLSLVKVHAVRNTIEMHPVVQKVTRDRLRQEDEEAVGSYRRAVHTLLAASDPGSPEQEENDAQYDRSLPHLIPTGAIESNDQPVRDLIINQVTRLAARGGHVEAVRLAEPALEHWRSVLGCDDIQVLALATQLGMALRLVERREEAHALNEDTLRRLREKHGNDRLTTLICANSYGADLRDSFRYAAALKHDLEELPLHEAVLGPDHHRTLNVVNNVAADYRRLGDFGRAHEYDVRAYAGRERLFGPAAVRTLKSLTSVAYDLRGLGRYEESLEITRQVVETFAARSVRENIDWIDARKRLGVALRKAGYHDEACQEAAATYRDYSDYLGPKHRYTLTSATCLINDYRLIGDLEKSRALGASVLADLKAKYPSHPTTFAAQVNYAIACRQLGQPSTARDHDEEALNGLQEIFGDRHPFTLSARTNLASDLAMMGETAHARTAGEQVVELSREVRGHDHPDTLAAAANLAADLRSGGQHERASTLLREVLDRYRETLGEGHPEALRAAERGRIDVDIEPF